MIFSWFRNRRRKALLATPFPEEWVPWLEEMPFYRGLTEDELSYTREISLYQIKNAFITRPKAGIHIGTV